MDGRTFAELILDAAERLGVAEYVDPLTGESSAAQIPTDPHNLDRCKRLVNRGIRRFYAANPRWRFLEDTVKITISNDPANAVDGDTARWKLPPGFEGAPRGRWSVNQPGTFVSSTWIIHTDANRVRAMLAQGQNVGRPTMAATRPLTKERSWELLVYPRPDQVYQVAAEYVLMPRDLVELDDRHYGGRTLDHAVLQCVLYEMAIADAKNPNEQTVAIAQANMDTAMAQAFALDRANRPAQLGQLNDPSIDDGTITRADVRGWTRRGPIKV
jgi:hypothetical protein